ncbi:MAG: serine/threonine protein kinase [Kaiparowitsia implicata GSE-PSE-MK54-09C]|jgi:serine/threonine protein kinase|nr:serine/threonine protein kinase [Kaiparowitsia implicata GSE-PSE-MK54-09C]
MDARFCQSCGASLLLGDRFRAVAVLGQGGFGKTLLAVDEAGESDRPPESPEPRRPCVIKQLLPIRQDAEAARQASEMFRQEAEQLKRLGNHPQIPSLYAFVQQGDCDYLVQEYINGQTLAQELEDEGRFSDIKILRLLNELLPVLQRLHDHQIIHRDIKPTNLIRRSSRQPEADGDLVLVDFGASKYATRDILAKTGTVIGSAGYAAPEQVMGKAEFASDIYSLGVTCVHLLTGLHPFDLYSPLEDRWIWQDYAPPAMDSGLVQVLDKMLRRATGQRFRSAAAVMKALNASDRPIVRLTNRVPASEPTASSELAVLRRQAVTAVPASPTKSPAEPQSDGSRDIAQTSRRNGRATPLADPLTATRGWTCSRTLIGHEGNVTAIAISPDGLLIASGSADCSIKLWHLDTGTLLHTFSAKSMLSPGGHSDRISALTFSPDGRLLISGSDDCTVIWWDVESRKSFLKRRGHEWVISAIAPSQNGQLLASGGGDGLINLWDLTSGEPLARLHKHRDRITQILLSPDGQTLVSSSYDTTIRLWDLKGDRLISSLRGHTDRITDLAIAPNWLTLVSTGWDRTLRFWDLSHSKQIRTILAHQDEITCLAMNPSGTLLASGSEDNRIKLWSLRSEATGITQFTGDRPLTLPYAWSLSAIAFSPDGQTLVSGSADETIRIWQRL